MKLPIKDVYSLEYANDCSIYASCLADLPGFALLESRYRGSRGAALKSSSDPIANATGRYDIIAALPESEHICGETALSPTAWVRAVEAQLSARPGSIALGLLSFDTGAHYLGCQGRSSRASQAGIYRHYVVQDHHLRRAYFVTDDTDPNGQQIADRLSTTKTATAAMPAATFCLDHPFTPDISGEDYRGAIATIRRYIAEGDCYQVNYAHRFSSQFSGDTYEAYLRLRDLAPGNYSAYLRLGPNHSVLSMSPERFLSVRAGHVVTQPIKGTRPRATSPEADAAAAQELLNSPKDRAENIMITDLLRNDLGRYCQAGSVVTPELCKLESYANVHHLVSRIEGQLAAGVSLGDLLMGCSPGGSITGAPKKRAVEIIQELESADRGAYCGSVFAMNQDWLQSSIAIRTIEAVDSSLYCWGGGGITFDSDADLEYQETLDKVSVFMRALEEQRRDR